MPGVEHRLYPFLRSARRLHFRRPFSTQTSLRSQEGHHTYFQHDSSTLTFPDRSTLHSDTVRGYSPYRELSNGYAWLVFLGGFCTFPLACLGYYWGDWAFGSKLWKSELKDLQEHGLTDGSRSLTGSSESQFMDAGNLFHVLQRANAETKALHDLILLWINPEKGLHATRDTQLLKKRPIKMSDGKHLDHSKAILIRILDKDAKTLVLLLGVDMSEHPPSESNPELSWCHDYALRKWMDERAEELKENDEVAGQGVSLYCYTATSSATSLPSKKGEMWQEARLFPEDLPNGFPLSALEKVKE